MDYHHNRGDKMIKLKNILEGTCGYGINGELGDKPAGPHLFGEGRPMFQDTPNEFAYLDFKKWAYKNRKFIKKYLRKAVEAGRDPGTDIFLALRELWLSWASQHAKEFSRIPNRGPQGKDFGRALAMMMKKDNLIIKKSGNKLTDIEEDVRKRGNKYCAYVDDKLTRAEKEGNPKKYKGKKVGSIQKTKSGKIRMKARACYGSRKKANNAMAAAMMSDIRMKENISQTGVSPSGIPVYQFNYKGDSTKYSGTMAQDLIKLGMNDAVSKMDNGYYGVHYNMIDVDFLPSK